MCISFFQRLILRFVKTSVNAHAPTYGSAAAAGADLYSAENVTVPAKGKYCVSTDLQVELPFGYYGRVAPRSGKALFDFKFFYLGLAAKNFIDVGAGVVDSDYRGVLKVLLFNFSEQDFEVCHLILFQLLCCFRSKLVTGLPNLFARGSPTATTWKYNH